MDRQVPGFFLLGGMGGKGEGSLVGCFDLESTQETVLVLQISQKTLLQRYLVLELERGVLVEKLIHLEGINEGEAGPREGR